MNRSAFVSEGLKRLVWALIGVAVTVPAVWLHAAFVLDRDAERKLRADRAALIEACRKENAVAVVVLNSETNYCVGGSGRAMPMLRHPLKGS